MMRIKVKISKTDLKQNAYFNASERKLKTNDVDKSNSALVSNLIYNMLLKERNKK